MTDSGEKTSLLLSMKNKIKKTLQQQSQERVYVSCRFVRNLSTSKEGWIAAANLITLIGKSKSCQSLTSSGIQTNNPK